jgi:hypothetical protein
MATEVIVRARSGGTLALGITAVIFGGISLCGSWIPFLGILTMPIAFLGAVLGGIGLLLSVLRGFKTAGVPLVGTAMCAASLAIASNVTLTTANVMQDAGRTFEQARVEAQRQEATRQEAKRRESDDYIAKFVDLYDFEATYFNALLEGRVPGVTFKIRNRGDRTLERVQVVVHFVDANGKVIAEEDFVPIREFGFNSNSKPLKPGYVWQIEKDKRFTASGVPSEWVEGRATAKITDVDLAAPETAMPPR